MTATYDTETQQALSNARALASLGVPVFAAYQDGSVKSPTGFILPPSWQTTKANPDYVDAWRPGMALCAVMGQGIDLIDIDPRSGGNISVVLDGLIDAEAYAVASSPSGGFHFFIKSQGFRSKDGLLPGVDYKAGDANGRGRGFAFIAPTERASKVDGERRPYHWQRFGPLDGLAEDTSGVHLRELLAAGGSRKSTANGSKPEEFVVSEDASDLLERDVREGGRHAAAVRVAGWFAVRLPDLESLTATLMSWNLTHCKPPLEEAEVMKISGSIWAKEQHKDAPGASGQSSSSSASASSIESEWPAPMAEEAFYGLAGKIVRAVHEVSEADDVATLVHLLVAFGNAIGPGPHSRVQHDQHPARLFAVLVGDSGKGRKGTAWSEPRSLFEPIVPDWIQRVSQGGLSSGEGLIYAVRDALVESQPIKEKGRVVAYEDVCVDPGVDDKRLLVIEEEFAALLAVMKREGNTVSAILRQAWDHGRLKPMTKNNRISATGAHISIIGHVTRTELRAKMDDTAMANGFANRFLWVAVRRTQYLPETMGLNKQEVAHLAREVNQSLVHASSMEEVGFDPEARALWAEGYRELSEGKPGLAGAAVARAEPQVLRLALTYAMLDRSTAVRVEHLRAALAVWRYCEDSVRWIFGSLTGDPVTDSVVSALRGAGESGISGTELHNALGRHQSAARLSQILDSLIAQGRVTAHREETAGRPRNVFVWRGG